MAHKTLKQRNRDTNDGTRKIRDTWSDCRKAYYQENRCLRFNRRFGFIVKDGETLRS